MRTLMLDLMDAMAKGVATLEAGADELAWTAHACGEAVEAEVMRDQARAHRVKALEMRGRLAALTADHDALFGRAP